MSTLRFSCLLALSATLAFASHLGWASGGGEVASDTSTPRIQPELPAVGGFLDGKLGVLWPSYDRRFLLIAYRVASGLPAVSDADRALLTAAPDTKYQPPPPPRVDEAIGRWTRARGMSGAAAPPYDLVAGWREKGYYSYANNCDAHAFETAAITLAARTQAQPAAIAELKQWVAAQDSVFSACDPEREIVPMPALDDGAPDWLVRDRAYQNAALQFYRHDYAAAQAGFDAIANDAQSPWREWAGYLRVRAWWRGTFPTPEDYRRFVTETPDWKQHPMLVALQRAGEANDPAVKQAAAELQGALMTRFAPKETIAAHWATALAPQPVAHLNDWERDLRFIWAVASEAELGDDWLYATRWLQSTYYDSSTDPSASGAFTRLRARWDAKPTPIVLASLLMAATPNTPGITELVNASREIHSGTPLYVHFAWQRARLALAAGKVDETRRELTSIDATLATESLGTRQHFDQLAMLAAESLDGVATHLLRKAVIADDAWGGYVEQRPAEPGEPSLDTETWQWLATRVHGEDLLQLARNATLPKAVRQQLAGEAWRWGALLPDETLELAALAELVAIEPDATLGAALQARRLDEVRFLAARRLLNGQMLRLASAGYGGSTTAFMSASVGEALTPSSHWNAGPAFYDAARRSAQLSAYATLLRSNETTWMGQQILPWLRSHRDTADAPATLRELVYASRYGAKDTPTSREAFQLLHKQYPKSDEARDTKYYY